MDPAGENESEPVQVSTPTERAGPVPPDPPRSPLRRVGSALREAVVVLGSAIVLSLLIKTFLVQAFYIPSGSMEPTLSDGDRVMVSKLVPGIFDVNRGDIVVFVDPGGWLSHSPDVPRNGVTEAVSRGMEFIGLLPADADDHLIKRVIGVGGDHVVCCDDSGRVSVNGVAISEPYLIAGAAPSDDAFDVVVPAEHLFVMGDNRPNSRDSRYNPGSPGGGMIPVRNVVGSAFTIIWPIENWTVLRNPGETFDVVPELS